MPYQPYRPYVGTRRKRKPEEGIQLRVCNFLKREFPEVDFHSDMAAGMHMTMNQAKIRKAMNSGRGWSDLLIMAPSRGYAALFVELKREDVAIYVTRGPRKGELVADEQIRIEADFLNRMNKLGYLARFAVGYQAAIDLIRWYFNVEEDTSSPF